jgi:hypothetical protein
VKEAFMRVMGVIGGVAVLGLMSGCIHVAGTVTQMDGRPLSTAVFSIGRPEDIANYGTHSADANGHFDFYIGPVDETNLFLYDGSADPKLSIRQVDPDQISGHMKLRMVPIIQGMDPSGNKLE